VKRVVLVMFVLCVLGACKKKSGNVVARLEQMTAVVERMPKEAAPWQGAHVGDTFILGSAVRTGAASTAKLKVGKSGKLDVSPSSVVYFTRTPGRERNDLRVETGTVELEAGEETIGVGEAVLEAGGKATLESGPDGTTILVRVGRVVLEDNVIEQGERVTVGPAGKAVAVKNTADASVEELPAGQAKVTVTGAPANVKTATGESELAVGEHRLETGATLTVPAGSTVSVARGDARAETAGPSALKLGDGTTLVEVTSGDVALHGDAADAVAAVPGGAVTAKTGGAAAIHVEKDTTAVDGQQGETSLRGKKGEKIIGAGESATMAANGEITVSPPPPERTVASISAGESPVLHDPKAPVPVRVEFGEACPSTGVVELAREKTFKKPLARSGGTGSANVLVPAGSFHYRVRCIGGAGATGTLRVDRESGHAPLPKTAARTTVEMDGREYTILYQNLLPEVTLAWRKAPAKPSYTFVIKPAKGAEKRLNNPGASLKLSAGELREGTYTTWVEAVLGARSEESRIVIEFDNAAPSASIEVSANANAFRVKGNVLDGSTVSANGKALPLDRHLRFEGEVAPGEREDGIAVRIAHPKAGIHYYVTRR
jgi:hypothetical protein